MPPRFKVFLDTSVIISGLLSPTGASAAILSLFKLNKIEIIISEDVVEEGRIVIARKFPYIKQNFENFLFFSPKILKRPSTRMLKKASKILISEDTAILASFLESKAKYLISLDKRFIQAVKKKLKNQETLLPSEFLEKYKIAYKSKI